MKRIEFLRTTRILFFVIAGMFALTGKTDAQISFDYSFPHSGTITRLEKDGLKFYLMDAGAGECRIYNMDYSLFRKIKLDIPLNRYLYDVQLVTQNLFDLDDGVELLYVWYEYVQTQTSYYYIYTTRIINENGSVLIDLPGCSWTDIRNSEDSGSRMLNYITDYSVYPYPVETRIYRLPGKISGTDPRASEELADLQIFPNPTSGPVRMGPAGFPNTDKAEWVVLDVSGKFIARVPALDSSKTLDLNALGLVNGIYLVRLETKNYQTKFQQIVLNN